MAGVSVYTFHESGPSVTRSRSGMTAARAAEILEDETATAEQFLRRSRFPYTSEHTGERGFQVGTGADPSYMIIVTDTAS